MSTIKAFLHFRLHAAHQLEAMSALAVGLKNHGISSKLGNSLCGIDEADFVVSWGDKLPAQIQIPRLILEAGYINGQSGDYVRDRLQFISTGWNGLHGRADSGRLDCPSDRFDGLGIELSPWRTGGNYALICGQHPGDSCAPTTEMTKKIADEVQRVYLEYRFRPHPLIANTMRPLRDALADARVCVTWNSTSAIEAVIAGVPTIALDRGSMAWDVTSHAVSDELFRGDRSQWAYNLAYRQFTHDELASGVAWEVISDGFRK